MRIGYPTAKRTYDALGNLRSVGQPDGTLIEYVIDGRNRCVGKKVNGVLVKGWLYADQLRMAELDGTGAVVDRQRSHPIGRTLPRSVAT